MLFSLRKHHLDLFVAGTALKVSRSLYCFTTSHGVEVNFPRLWGTGISDAISEPTGVERCNTHGQCDQIFMKVGDGRLRQ